MKLYVKKKYFDLIKSGMKIRDYRDAHITFICEETGEMLCKDVIACNVEHRPKKFHTDVLEDENMIVFEFRRN